MGSPDSWLIDRLVGLKSCSLVGDNRLWTCDDAEIMKRILILISISLILMTYSVLAASITLSWQPNPEPDISHYIVYYGPASNHYTNSVRVHGVRYTAIGLEEGRLYYFRVRAVDRAGQIGEASDEVRGMAIGSESQADYPGAREKLTGDLNGDGDVDGEDLAQFAQQLLSSVSYNSDDADGDQAAIREELSDLANNFGTVN